MWGFGSLLNKNYFFLDNYCTFMDQTDVCMYTISQDYNYDSIKEQDRAKLPANLGKEAIPDFDGLRIEG